MLKKNELIILGSGPAGYTAAIYSSRANLKTTLITGIEVGGQLSMTNEIENWPGDSEGLTGPILMKKMELHAKKLGTNIIFDQILKVDLHKKPFRLVGNLSEYFCNALIVATGAKPRYLELESEKKYIGKGVSVCATCDGFFFKNKIVSVIGGGNTAIEEALYLSKIAKKVHLIHRRKNFRAEKMLLGKLETTANLENIILHTEKVVHEILGNEKQVTGIKLKIIKEKKEVYETLLTDGIFIAIGRTPNTEVFKKQIVLKDNYICVKSGISNSTATSIPGVFAAGDVVDYYYRQAITSAGSGCMAALDAAKYLEQF